MKLEQSHIDQIRIAFQQMQSKEDLLHVLNEVKPLIYGDKAVPFELKQLTWYANPKLGKKRYTEFKIKKKSGAERSIHAPIKGLKSLQKTLSFVLQCVYEPHNAAMGFVRDRSIVDNAKLHVGSKYVYNIDLKDFFPSVDQARVWKCLQLKPFNLDKASSVESQYEKWEDFKKEHLKTDESVTFLKGKGRMFTNTPYGTLYVANNFDLEKDKYVLLGGSSLKTKGGKSLEGTLWLVNKIPDASRRLEIANIIASICCTEMEVERKNEAGEWEKVKRNVLPQGAPTSPVITNIICQKLDKRLAGVAKRFGLKYSRYADDITFSSQHTIYQADSEFIDEIRRIITQQGFHIKESKTRLQKDGYRKEVTGLLVNEKVNVQQRYIKQLRMWLYYWETYGYERAYGFFLQQYLSDKGNIVKGKPDMANVIAGKLDYLKMVKGADNKLYVKLENRIEALTNSITTKISRQQHLDKVLDMLFDRGLDEAMDIYKPHN
jgi:retron-type reverse transcriptase